MLVSTRNRTKVFVIGLNKTGTTTIKYALEELGYIVANQLRGEKLLDEIIEEDFDSFYKYCRTAEVFQDAPFSFPGIFKWVDKSFPGSKYILTLRDSDDQWYNSLVNFHSKLWGNGKTPTENDLKKADYIYEGYPFKAMSYLFGEKLYDKVNCTDIYNRHNSEAKKYFANRINDFIVINVAHDEDYEKLCHFLGQKPVRRSFQWKNKTFKN
ncbi:sulfotransferase [Reichenbachiella sp.]